MKKVKLNLCEEKLSLLGIHMMTLDSGSKLNKELAKVNPTFIGWDYVHADDSLTVYFEEGSEVPDLSRFGRVEMGGDEG